MEAGCIAYLIKPFSANSLLGQSGNPAARPKASGHLLAENFKRDLVDE